MTSASGIRCECVICRRCFLAPLVPEQDATRRGYQLIGASTGPGTFFIIIVSLQPQSEGRVRIQSSHPLTTSLADNNYFGNDVDVTIFMEAIRQYLVPIAVGFIDLQYSLLSPDASTIDDDDLLSQFILMNFDHTHHWASSCRMAKTVGEGVVDGRGKNVFGMY